MQITLHAGPHTDGSHLMAEHLQGVVRTALDRFGERVMHVDAHLADGNGATKTSGHEVHCTLHAHVAGMEPVVVKDQAGSAHQAIDGAVRKLKRAVGTTLGKHDPRSQRPGAPAGDTAEDGA